MCIILGSKLNIVSLERDLTKKKKKHFLTVIKSKKL